MAQRRPHGQEHPIIQTDSAAAWRAGVLEESPKSADQSRQQNYADRPNPEKRKKRSDQEYFDEIRQRSEQRIRREQARRLAEERRQEELDRALPDQVHQKTGERPKMRNKPREISEEELRKILLQARRERAGQQAYEQAGRRPQAEVRQQQRPDERRQAVRGTERRKTAEDSRAYERQRPDESRERKAASHISQQEVPADRSRKQKERRAAVPEKTKTAGTAKKKDKKVFSKGFKKGFFIAWGVFVVLLIAAMAVLWSFLARYEAGLPEHYMNQIIEDLRSGSMDSLHVMTQDEVSIDDPSLFSAGDTVSGYLKDRNAENSLRYVKINAESSADENVYMIRSGDENILKVYLERDPADSGKNRRWQEQKTLIVAENLQPAEITVQIPSSCTLEIDRKAVDRSFITEEGSRIQLLSKLIDEGILTDAPTVDTYTVRGLFAEPEIMMTDADGTSRPCTKIGDVYSAGFEADDAFISEQTERVLSLFEPYAKYFSGDAGREALGRVMLDDSPAYISAASADVSWMQEHDGIALSEESVSNFKKYSDDCYSCDIRFVQDILRDDEVVRTWDTNMTWIMVKDGNYYLADLLTKTADD